MLPELYPLANYDKLKDHQIYPGDPDETKLRANASKACSKCPGYCCLAFRLSFASIKEIKEAYQKTQRRVDKGKAELANRRKHREINLMRDLPVDFCAEDRIVRDLERQLESAETDRYNMEFFSKNAVQLKDAHGRGWGSGTFTCRQFDHKNSRCMAYDSRPSICKQFVCGAACLGHAPGIDGMHAHPNIVIGIADKLRECKNVPFVWPKKKPSWLVRHERKEKAARVKLMTERSKTIDDGCLVGGPILKVLNGPTVTSCKKRFSDCVAEKSR